MTTGKGRINGKLLLRGVIRTVSPVLVGTGRGEQVDTEVSRLPDGRPFIPGTSLAGALRHHLEDAFSGLPDTGDYFWGTSKTTGTFYQGHFVLDDLAPLSDSDPPVTVRDGVSISAKTGIALDRRKYEYEVLEPGARFDLSAEATLRDGFDRTAFLELIRAIVGELEKGRVRLGALASKGFGRVKLEADWNLYEFSFSGSCGGPDWLRFCATGELPGPVATPFNGTRALAPKPSRDFVITADFRLRGSLIIGAPGDGESDKGTLKSAGSPVISGPSLKGALRARAARIVNTLGGDAEILNDLFGWAEDGPGKRAIKSRLEVEESVIPANAAVERSHARIRVDRFTGGVHSHFLFDSRPLWRGQGDGEEDTFRICLTLGNYEEGDKWGAGLLLLLLRDLWTGDLPLGGEKNIGRGVLEGLGATVACPGWEVEIKPAGTAQAGAGPAEASLVVSLVGSVEDAPDLRKTLDGLVEDFYLEVTP